MISQVYTPTGEVADTAAYLANVLGAREAAGRIYLARAASRLKIGWTRGDPAKRVATLQIACPFPLQLLIHIPGDRQHEQMLHSVFSRFHLHGEWFKQHADIAWTFKRIQEVTEPECSSPAKI